MQVTVRKTMFGTYRFTVRNVATVKGLLSVAFESDEFSTKDDAIKAARLFIFMAKR